MAWNGSGNFNRTNGVNTGTGVWTADRDASVKITAARHDTHDQDLAAGINACLAKNGENAMTGDLNLGTNDITNGGAATFSGAVTGGTVLDAAGNARSGRRNLLFNGGFDIWQRGTSFSIPGTGAVTYGADRFASLQVGTATTVTRQSFSIGQTSIPIDLTYYHSSVVTAGSAATDYSYTGQRIEGVRTAQGRKITVSFWVGADATKNISVSMVQNFGTGGSPSASVFVSGQKFAIGTTWTKIVATFDVPRISGKTLGTDGNDCLQVRIWFSAGSNFNSNTATLGHQSGTFKIAAIQAEIGEVATDFEQLPIGETLALCQRHYQKTYVSDSYAGDVSTSGRIIATAAAATTTGAILTWHMPVEMFGTPSVAVYSPATGAVSNVRNETAGADAASSTSVASSGRVIIRTNGAATDGSVYSCHITADAEL